MKKFIVIILCLVFVLSVAGCGTQNAENISATTELKTEQEIEQESENQKVTKSIEMDEEPLNIVEVCVQYLSDNEPAEVMSSITNMKKPEIRTVEELPDAGIYLKISDKAGTGPYDIVTFTTTDDDLLGPLKFIVNQEKQIVGIFYRE